MKNLKSLIFIVFLICSVTLMSAQPSKKVVILDSIQAKKIINQLIQGDIAKAENKILKQMDSVSQKRILTLKEASKMLEKAYSEKEKEVGSLKTVIESKDKIINRERNKKQFWKITGIVGVSASIFLVLLK